MSDTKSALYLKGTCDKMIGGGFKFSNPMLRLAVVAVKVLVSRAAPSFSGLAAIPPYLLKF